MTGQQKDSLVKLALDVKKALNDFYGSVTFHLSGSKKDVKIEMREMSIAKADFIKSN